jgi:AraC-like DNA-binding protein
MWKGLLMLEPQIKVWRPQGFDGLEVDMMNGILPFDMSFFVTDYEISAHIAGRGQIQYRKETVATQGSWANPNLLVQSPGELATGSSPQGDALSVWTLRLHPDLVDSILRDRLDATPQTIAFPKTTLDDSSLNHNLALATRDTIRSFDLHTSRLERDSLLTKLVLATVEHCNDSRLPVKRLTMEPKAVRVIKDHLGGHFAGEISLENLASMVCLNKFHLLQVFKREVGISPHVYQTSLRIRRAKHLLSRGLPISQVAYDVGFVDQSHLNRQFKKYVLVTPGQFQRDSLERH